MAKPRHKHKYKTAKIIPLQQKEEAQPNALYNYGGYYPIYPQRFDGETNNGEMGPIKKYLVDHNAVRLRSWQLMLESEVVQMVVKSLTRWVIGSGLKLQAEPQKEVLDSEKIAIGDTEEFNSVIESRWKVFAHSSMADLSNRRNLHTLAAEAFTNAVVGGDGLVICRIINGYPTVQLIDGEHIQTPPSFASVPNTSVSAIDNYGFEQVAPNGNRVRWGVEIDSAGQPVAYYVRVGFGLDFERVEARGGKSGALLAFMVYGTTYRQDNLRGIPWISAVMETCKQLERYKAAIVGSAEERVKIPYFFEHGVGSNQEDPMATRRARATAGFNVVASDMPTDINSKQLAQSVAVSTNKTVFDLPNDVTIKALESKQELYFKEFYEENINLVCAAVGIPPEVALNRYGSNYSASRAAIKAWEMALHIMRKQFALQFYQPIYDLFMDTQVLSLKIQAPGYLTALSKRNLMAINAYRMARWVGAPVPHIDPEKEVKAERAKLGGLATNMPLTTLEAATETLNGGESYSNIKQFAKELEEARKEGLQLEEQTETERVTLTE